MFLLQINKVADTSAADARNGKDIQGIPWERLRITRDVYRQTRLEQYKNYENIPHSGEFSRKVISDFISFLSALCKQDYLTVSYSCCMQDCKITKKVGLYYEFRRKSRSVKSNILHFQVSDKTVFST